MTYGEQAVGLSFNPSGSLAVDETKRLFARMIDVLHHKLMMAPDSEAARICSIAIAEAQTAQMWAVKALTWQE